MSSDNPQDDLIPLAIAVRILYAHFHGTERPVAHVLERLNALAYSLADVGGTYAIEGEYRLARRLSREELASGVFRHGATELHFLDERPMLTRIAVSRDTVERTIQELALGRTSGTEKWSG
jgi:hypothetical protein